ncbi:urease accessory protein UreE [Dactylosporangium sp. CA-139066]|uniref:urease accessory protein UreE n=1 Tax=Dactylosporangium sp. CA-139066 TaxID=3239930 RepID=UPI003D907B58
MLIETVRGNVADEPWSRAASVDVLRLDQWEAQKNRLRKSTEAGVPVELSLDRGTRLADGDVLWSDAGGAKLIVARLDLGEVMIVDLPEIDPADPGAALRCAVELGHALGNQHWPAVIQGDRVLVPVTLDRRVMDSVMRTHAFTGLSHRFAAAEEVIPYLAPHETRRLFGGAAVTHEHPVPL